MLSIPWIKREGEREKERMIRNNKEINRSQNRDNNEVYSEDIYGRKKRKVDVEEM